MAVLKGPVRLEEYDPNWSPPPPPTKPEPINNEGGGNAEFLKKVDAMIKVGASGGEGDQKENIIMVVGDIEAIDAKTLTESMPILQYPVSLMVRQGGYIDCHWSEEAKNLWRVKAV